MSTILRLGRADHGRPLTLEEFTAGEYEPGYKYELIDGKLEVSPAANFPEIAVQLWLYGQVNLYARANPELVKFVTAISRSTTCRWKSTTAAFDSSRFSILWQSIFASSSRPRR